MTEAICVTAKTPNGDTCEYIFIGNLDTPADQIRFSEFMIQCCDDCADWYGCPVGWDEEKWHNQTMAMWNSMTSNRKTFGPPVEYDPLGNYFDFGGAR